MRGMEESAAAKEDLPEKTSLSNDDIDRAVEDYRRHLELEQQAEEKSEVLQKKRLEKR